MPAMPLRNASLLTIGVTTSGESFKGKIHVQLSPAMAQADAKTRSIIPAGYDNGDRRFRLWSCQCVERFVIFSLKHFMNHELWLALAFCLVSLINPSIVVAYSYTNRCVHCVCEEAIR